MEPTPQVLKKEGMYYEGPNPGGSLPVGRVLLLEFRFFPDQKKKMRSTIGISHCAVWVSRHGDGYGWGRQRWGSTSR